MENLSKKTDFFCLIPTTLIYKHKYKEGMKKVSLIIRAYNRLEYTIETLSNILETTNYENYEIIIINNNSTDGTGEWLEWVQINSPVYGGKFKHIKMDKNIGDWYGMVEGLKHISDDSEYIVQVDNDITVSDPEWLGKMVYLLENTPSKTVMLKRTGLLKSMPVVNIKEIKYKDEVIEYGIVNRPVCCYIIGRKDFTNFTIKFHNIKGNQSKHLLGQTFRNTLKITNVISDVHLNNTKYMFNNKNVWAFI